MAAYKNECFPCRRHRRPLRSIASIVLFLGASPLLLLSTIISTPICTAIRIHRFVSTRNDTAAGTPKSKDLPRSMATVHVNVDVPSSPDGHLIQDALPLTKSGQELKIKHWAGHLPASNDQQKYFFYWLFEPEKVDANTPLLIWLNGGPACSSMDGLFLENGPIQWTVVDGKYMLQQNPFSWHKAPAYTLYIDQPVGTGLSFTTNDSYPTNDEEINVDFYYFLTQFFDLHADKFVQNHVVTRKVFFSGESHAGHYIPSMMNYILKQNLKGTRGPQIPLAGAAIGNGFFDPIYQYTAAQAAYGHGLIDRAQLYHFVEAEKQCQQGLQKGGVPDICFDLLDDILDGSFGESSNYRLSAYDVRVSELKKSPRKYPKGHKITECYLGGYNLPSWEAEGTMDCDSVRDSVLEAIHALAATAAGQIYEECTDPPYDALSEQEGKGVVLEIVDVLQHPTKPRLLFFNGIQDLVCNHVGNERALENLPWHGKDEWIESKRFAWILDRNSEKAAGFVKEYQNLSFLKLLDAGHMVPMDLPEVSLHMMEAFLLGASLSSSEQLLGRSKAKIPNSCGTTCDICEAPRDCVACPFSGGSDPSCEDQVAKAKDDALASIKDEGKSGEAGVGPVLLAIVSVAGFLVYGIWTYFRQQKKIPSTPIEADNIELQPQYRDDAY